MLTNFPVTAALFQMPYRDKRQQISSLILLPHRRTFAAEARL